MHYNIRESVVVAVFANHSKIESYICSREGVEIIGNIKSLCPECARRIDAVIFEEGGKVKMRKHCPEHGEFEDVYWSDAAIYRRFMSFLVTGSGVENPMTEASAGCPYDCGLCPNHSSTTILANIDVTNRCNQRCPICFANSADAGYVYEPSVEQIRKMMLALRSEKPAPCPVIQFSGGEPTVREDLPELISMARELGFSQIQIATNGVRIAKSVDYVKKLEDAGLSTVYLQFDGLRSDIYAKLRGYNAMPRKLKAIENCRKAGMGSVVLVQTLARGINEDQVGALINFAVKNRDVVKAVNVQPVSFTGRIDRKELSRMRITVPDFMKIVEEQTDGEIATEDFYPVPCVEPIAALFEAWDGSYVPTPTCHPACGAATFVFVDGGKLVPLTRFIDFDGLLELSRNLTAEMKSRNKKVSSILKLSKDVLKLVDVHAMPKKSIIPKLLVKLFRDGNREALAEIFRNTLFIGGMHFQDLYNIDLDRLHRCVIHYATPDGRVIPFCTYNSLHRDAIEKKFSKPIKGSRWK